MIKNETMANALQVQALAAYVVNAYTAGEVKISHLTTSCAGVDTNISVFCDSEEDLDEVERIAVKYLRNYGMIERKHLEGCDTWVLDVTLANRDWDTYR